MTQADMEGCWLAPWACFDVPNKGQKGDTWKSSPINTSWKYCNENDGWNCRNDVMDLIKSKAFHNLVRSKKVVSTLQEGKDTPILEYDKYYSSNGDINELIATGRPFL
jgi:hypothetical protein